MKVTYYSYFCEHNGNRYQFRLNPILNNFCRIADERFRRSFLAPTGDNLFIFQLDQRIFLFIITKNDEIIKAVDRTTINHEDIYSRLEEDETLGFASYIYVGNNYYGIASTFFGPKNSYFTHFLNLVFERLQLSRYYICSEAFPVSSTTETAMRLAFKGQTLITINNTNPIFQQLQEMFGWQGNEARTITIEIKPDPKREMSRAFDAIVNRVPLDGVEKYIVRGKEFLEDCMTDFYIVGTGHISDSIQVRGDRNICRVLEERATNNRLLREKVRELANDPTYIHDDIQDITNFGDLNNWNDYL